VTCHWQPAWPGPGWLAGHVTVTVSGLGTVTRTQLKSIPLRSTVPRGAVTDSVTVTGTAIIMMTESESTGNRQVELPGLPG